MSHIRPAAVIILAAGEGRRMRSGTPKVLHTLCGRSMLGYVLAAARSLLNTSASTRGDRHATRAIMQQPSSAITQSHRLEVNITKR